jgi:hypothetical protein
MFSIFPMITYAIELFSPCLYSISFPSSFSVFVIGVWGVVGSVAPSGVGVRF